MFPVFTSLLLASTTMLAGPVDLHILTVPPLESVIPAQESMEALVQRVAYEEGISPSTLYNLAWSESRLEPDPEGHNDGGKAAGIVQIHYETWNFTKDQVLDPEFSLRFAAKHIKTGDAWKYWTALNCYTYVSHLVSHLPKMDEIITNTSVPHKGQVAIFWYRDKQTGTLEKHVAKIITEPTGGSFTVAEANYTAGLIDTRVILTSDTHLAGYFDPEV